MIPACHAEGLGLIPWSPLARGVLTRPRAKTKGSTVRSDTDVHADRLYANADWEVVDVVENIAEKRGISMAQVALAWVLSKPDVTAPIIGATRLEHLEESFAALEVKLTAEEITELERPYTPKAVTF